MGNSGNTTDSVRFQILICSEGEYRVRTALRRSVTSLSKAIVKSTLLFKGSFGKVLTISPLLMAFSLELLRTLLTIPPMLCSLTNLWFQDVWEIAAGFGRGGRPTGRLLPCSVHVLHTTMAQEVQTIKPSAMASDFLPIMLLRFRMCS